jgi:hypothetical protein
VSLKHNSRFASFNLIAKGDYTCELDIPLPFSLISNDETANRLVIMPAYWFMYNMYALARNAYKYVDRDKRIYKHQVIEYDFLAPDSISEVLNAIRLLEKFTALSLDQDLKKESPEEQLIAAGRKILQGSDARLKEAKIYAHGFENNKRPTLITKAAEAYRIYRELVVYYFVSQLIDAIPEEETNGVDDVLARLKGKTAITTWHNIGGQLIPEESLNHLLGEIKNKNINTWDQVHKFYREAASDYKQQKLEHAYATLIEMLGISEEEFSNDVFYKLPEQALATREWMVKGIYNSRAKDYSNSFRTMVYDSAEEMEEVIGRLDDNPFLKQQEDELVQFRKRIEKLLVTR